MVGTVGGTVVAGQHDNWEIAPERAPAAQSAMSFYIATDIERASPERESKTLLGTYVAIRT